MIVAVAGGDVIVVTAADSNIGIDVVGNGEIEIVARIKQIDLDWTNRYRCEDDRVAGQRGVRDRLVQRGEAAIAEEHVASAAVLDELDVRQRVGAVSEPAVDLPAATARDDVGQGQGACIDGRVDIAAAVERVGAAGAGEHVGTAVAGERIGSAAADDVFDARGGSEAGGSIRVEIDGHRIGSAGVVQRVGAALVQAERRLLDIDDVVGYRQRVAIARQLDDAGAADHDLDGVGAGRAGDRQRVAVRAAVEQRIGTVAGDIVDGVGAATAAQRIGAPEAGEGVVAVIAGDDIGEAVAGDCDVALARQGDVVDASAERQRQAGRAGRRRYGEVIRRCRGDAAGAIAARADMDGVAGLGGIRRPLQARRGSAGREEAVGGEIDMAGLQHDRAVGGIVHRIQDLVGERQQLCIGSARQQDRIEGVVAARSHIRGWRALIDDVGLAGAAERIVGDRDGPGGHVAAQPDAQANRVVGKGVAVEVQPEKRAGRVGADAGTPAGGGRGVGVDDVGEGVASYVDVGVVGEQEAVIGDPSIVLFATVPVTLLRLKPDRPGELVNTLPAMLTVVPVVPFQSPAMNTASNVPPDGVTPVMRLFSSVTVSGPPSV